MADSNRLGTYHITSNLQEYETARSNTFEFLVQDLDDLLYPQYSYDGTNEKDPNKLIRGSVKTGGRTTYQDIIKLSVNKMFVPHFDLGMIEIKRGNSSVKFADTPTWQSGTLELQDFVGLETKSALMAWQALAYDVVTDTQGRAADWIDNSDEARATGKQVIRKGYKRNCKLLEYTPDYELLRTWTLVGCWIKSIQESPFEVSGTGGRQITVTLEYDRAIMEIDNSRYNQPDLAGKNSSETNVNNG